MSSARDDYPFLAAVAEGRVRGGSGLYDPTEPAIALAEIDRLRRFVESPLIDTTDEVA